MSANILSEAASADEARESHNNQQQNDKHSLCHQCRHSNQSCCENKLYISSLCKHVICSHCVQALVGESTSNDVPNSDTVLELSCSKCGTFSSFHQDTFLTSVMKLATNSIKEDEKIGCANCENTFSSSETFYCETCKQSLCPQCKILTHSARMFAAHTIVPSTNFEAVLKCCNHSESPAVIANLSHNEFVCVRCFSDFSETLKSSCNEVGSAIESRLLQLAQDVELLRTQQTIIRGRVLESESEFAKIQSNCSQRKQMVNSFAEKLISQIQSVQNHLIAELDNDLIVKQRNLECLKEKSDMFATSFELYESVFGVINDTAPDGNFLKISSQLRDRLNETASLKSEVLAHRISTEKSSHFDFKTPFKKVLTTLFGLNCNERLNIGGSSFNMDALQLQNLTLIRSLSQDPSHFQKLLDLNKPPSSPMKLSSPQHFSNGSTAFNLSVNSSGSHSSINERLCSEADDVKVHIRDLRSLFSNNVKRIQSLQLDVTRRKVYPKKQEADNIAADVANFVNLSNDLKIKCDQVVEKLKTKSHVSMSSPQSSSDDLNESGDVEFTKEKVNEWKSECEDLMSKHEKIKQILRSIKPYIVSVTKQKEKSHSRLSPVVQRDHIIDLKQKVYKTESLSEQRISAIEAMYKSQNAERASTSFVNNSLIEKELWLTKQKLKKPKVATTPTGISPMDTTINNNVVAPNIMQVPLSGESSTE